MNSTQYLIILITAVVCFCIYVLAEIVRLRKREKQLRYQGGTSQWPASLLDDEGDRKIRSDLMATRANLNRRLQEEIRNRLEGGDGA